MEGSKINRSAQAVLDGIPERVRSRYWKRALMVDRSFKAAIELKCLDCYAWEYTEAKKCESVGCPLYAIHSRIFGSNEGRETPEE